MNLLFDLSVIQAAGTIKRHGAAIYGEILFNRIIELGYTFSCVYNSKKWINKNILFSCKSNNLKVYDIEKISIEAIVKKYGIDVIYSPLINKELLNCPCRIIATIHGLRLLETPLDKNIFYYKLPYARYIESYFIGLFGLRKKLYRRSFLKKIKNPNFSFVTVSNHSKYSIYAFFPELRKRDIKVFYSPNTATIPLVKKQNNRDKYFFIVSGNRFEKNTVRVIKALDKLYSQGAIKNTCVKIAGCEKNHLRIKIKNSDKFKFLGYVSDDEMNHLYANSYLFLYLSLNEGFGYPPLEAMRYEIPTICSPYSSITEICEDAVVYANPFSEEEIMNRILRFYSDKDFYKFKSSLAKKRFEYIRNRQEHDLDSLVQYLFSN
jgi:hypothetical protein